MKKADTIVHPKPAKRYPTTKKKCRDCVLHRKKNTKLHVETELNK